jgi:hypothetical protein
VLKILAQSREKRRKKESVTDVEKKMKLLLYIYRLLTFGFWVLKRQLIFFNIGLHIYFLQNIPIAKK